LTFVGAEIFLQMSLMGSLFFFTSPSLKPAVTRYQLTAEQLAEEIDYARVLKGTIIYAKLKLFDLVYLILLYKQLAYCSLTICLISLRCRIFGGNI